ncbi:MAG: hypothetical protein ACREJ0_01565 [Geminicoccaceae bacterium]
MTFAPSVDDLLCGVVGHSGDVGQLGKELQQVADHFTGEKAKVMQSLSEDVARLIASVADAARQERSS